MSFDDTDLTFINGADMSSNSCSTCKRSETKMECKHSHPTFSSQLWIAVDHEHYQ